MLVYIIDGYNLVHKVPGLADSSSPPEELIHYIRNNKLTGSRNNKVIIVFDGYLTCLPSGGQYQIVFSAGRSADEVIKEKVSRGKNRSQIVVVSDDREIRDYVEREGAVVLRPADFIKKKDKTGKQDDCAKDISYTLQQEITEDLRRIWLSEKDRRPKTED